MSNLNDGYDRAVVVLHDEAVIEVILTNSQQFVGALNRACRAYLELSPEMPDELVEAAYQREVDHGSKIRILYAGTVTKEQYS